jgi:hypothetical protein
MLTAYFIHLPIEIDFPMFWRKEAGEGWTASLPEAPGVSLGPYGT